MGKKTRKSLADAMRRILDDIEDPKVDIRDARMECTYGNTMGAAEGGCYPEFRLNGVRTYTITLQLDKPDLVKLRTRRGIPRSDD